MTLVNPVFQMHRRRCCCGGGSTQAPAVDKFAELKASTVPVWTENNCNQSRDCISAKGWDTYFQLAERNAFLWVALDHNNRTVQIKTTPDGPAVVWVHGGLKTPDEWKALLSDSTKFQGFIAPSK